MEPLVIRRQCRGHGLSGSTCSGSGLPLSGRGGSCFGSGDGGRGGDGEGEGVGLVGFGSCAIVQSSGTKNEFAGSSCSTSLSHSRFIF